jgi:hypothetical protein
VTRAVGNTLAYVIANANLAGAYLVLIDDDCYDETSLNRCLPGRLERYRTPQGGRRRCPSGRGRRPRISLRRDSEELYIRCEARIARRCRAGSQRIGVCGRRVVRRQRSFAPGHSGPKLLLGGSTFNLQAKSHVYGLRPGAACLACFNPAERDGERLRAMENELRGMEKDARRRYLFERGLDADTIEDHLESVKCGSAGEAALRNFATRLPPEFSAGFVSLGAGLLLAAALIGEAAFPKSDPLERRRLRLVSSMESCLTRRVRQMTIARCDARNSSWFQGHGAANKALQQLAYQAEPNC